MNRKMKIVMLAIGLCGTPSLAQSSGAMVDEAKYKAAAQVEQNQKSQTQKTAPAYQNVKIYETVEQKKAKSQPKCGNCKGTASPQ